MHSYFQIPLYIILQMVSLKHGCCFLLGAVRKQMAPLTGFAEKRLMKEPLPEVWAGLKKRTGSGGGTQGLATGRTSLASLNLQWQREKAYNQSPQEGPAGRTQPLLRSGQGKEWVERGQGIWTSDLLVSPFGQTQWEARKQGALGKRFGKVTLSSSTDKAGKWIWRGKWQMTSTAQFMSR